ncbi:shikimate kinase [Novosphingobium sp. FSY-8]|uniref:Shikimate kinase n=1 Tax=Novosphingobium ovatum TaxID=1908523 RepID=A0ABW9XBA4_9SPHN|nr:shikimate kinase [Novosphingobium ovatum]NBC35799.1 shikimate kinase [Novosphingobium ovatum]
MEHEQPNPELAAQADIIARIDRPIVLVGMMGVGKTSVGKRLAALLNAPFLDADDEIEKAARMSIPDIFATYGEAFFRDGERRVIARLLGEPAPALKELSLPPVSPAKGDVRVISTGGGAFINEETRALILRRGIAVWLDADLDTLVERTARKDNRPLLKQGNPREILANLKTTRAPFYAQAPIHVISGNTPHAKTLAKLLSAVGAWLDTQEPIA